MHYIYNQELLADKNILLHHHLGLGDHISLCGMVNYISELHNPKKKIYLVCKSNNYQNVKKLYEKNSVVVPVDIKGVDEHRFVSEAAKTYAELECLSIGHSKYDESLEKKNKWDCNQVFYHLANIPYEYRFTKFSLPYNEKRNEDAYSELVGDAKNYIFVHDDPIRGYNIQPAHDVQNNLKIIRNDVRFGIFDYVKILRNATEIHAMPSSFYCLIESIEGIKGNLFCYPIRNANLSNTTRYKWNIISKDSTESK